MEFWNSLLTEKSWETLIELKKMPFSFILIGEWAAYLWTKANKSKDIDIALTSIKDMEYLKNAFNLRKNDRLKKYEIKKVEIDIDIYVPYYSALSIPIEELGEHSTIIDGIRVVKTEALLILKQGAEIQRKDSIKGQKDRIDIFSLLLYTKINFREYQKLIKKFGHQEFEKRLEQIIREFKETKYFEITPRQLKLKTQELLSKLRNE